MGRDGSKRRERGWGGGGAGWKLTMLNTQTKLLSFKCGHISGLNEPIYF